MEQSKRLSIKSTHIVTPAHPTLKPRTHFLSNLDLLYSEVIYDPNVFYFSPFDNANSSAELILALRDSLAKALVHYPVFAGRVRTGEDGRPYIDCNDEGVVLVEATADARFDEWKDLRDCSIEAYLNLGDATITDYSKAPLLRVQVTLFRCGGVAIGYGWSHICTDGWSAIEFIKSWSEIHRGLSISSSPTFDTHLLKARSPPSVDRPVKDYVFQGKGSQDDKFSPEVFVRETKLAMATFYFSASAVKTIVQGVESGPWGYPRPTSFEALVAVCWKAMTEARDIADDTISTYSYPINVRGRWDPPLPEGIFGNGAHLSCLGVNAGELKHNHFSYAAKAIRDDKVASGVEYLRSVVDLMQIEMDQGKVVGFNSDFYCGTDVQGSNFASFPVYEVDFGSGKPKHFSFTLDPLFGNGIAVILPTPHGGRSRYVSISMEVKHMEKLLTNELLKSFLGDDLPTIHHF